MLDNIYMQVLDMSKTASIVILVVVLARLLLKKAPKVFSYALWAVVLFRLLCPVTFEAPVSIVPEMNSVSQGYTLSEESISVLGAGEAAYQAVGDALNGGLGIQHIRTTEKTETGMTKYVTTDWWSVWILFGQYVWVAGITAMLIYSAVSYLKLRKKLSVVVPLRDNIFIADDIKSPFVVGLFRPKIYLPCNLGDKEQEYIILHEQHHIKRLDHVMKALAFFALAIHWFNPLVWVAFVLASKDMEMSCDEAVIRKVDGDVRADYSALLLTLATGRRIIAGTPLAFGEGDTKGRIRNLANWRKPAFWVVLVAVITCIALAVGLMTNPAKEDVPDSAEGSYFLLIGADGVETIEISGVNTSGGVVNADGSVFRNGEKVWLEPLQGVTDLRGYSITAFGKNGEILYTLSIPEGATNDEVINLIGSDGWLLAPTDCYTISHTGGASGPDSIISKQQLSLNDVIMLSQKGHDLTWSDFEQYRYIETGSGLYIRVYEINEMYELWIGGAGPNSDPMYIYLALADDLDTRIDIRDGGVTEFIGADHSEVLLTNAIYDAILEHNKPSEPDGLYHCASFVQMNRAEICIDSDPPSPIKVVVYGLALHQAFSFPDGHLRDEAGSHIPVKLAFAIENGVYTLLEYWEPRDGSYYAQDIRDEFPDAVEEDALDTQKYIVGQVQSCYDQAVRYGGIDPASVIENLLEVIASSPTHSSNPGDYIEEHAIEYRELTYYGRYTLQYCFGKFLQGKQTGLTGHIMALACQDIMLGWGEAYAMDQELMTGQEWFEEFRSNAGSLVGQYSNEELESLYPGAWLLLQMESLCGYPLATAQEVSMEVVKIDPNKIVTEPTDGFGAIVPKEWVERDSEMLIPVPEEDTDPNFSMPADGKAKGKTQIQIAPDP